MFYDYSYEFCGDMCKFYTVMWCANAYVCTMCVMLLNQGWGIEAGNIFAKNQQGRTRYSLWFNSTKRTEGTSWASTLYSTRQWETGRNKGENRIPL